MLARFPSWMLVIITDRTNKSKCDSVVSSEGFLGGKEKIGNEQLDWGDEDSVKNYERLDDRGVT